MAQSDVNEVAARLLLRARLKVLREVVKTEATLDRAYSRALRSLQTRLKGKPTKRVQALVLRKMRQISNEIEPIIERSIKAGTIAGDKVAREQFRKIYKGEDIGGFKFASPPTSAALARQRVRGALSVDKVSLSARLWTQHQERGLRMSKQITETLRAGESMANIADDLIKLDAAGGFAKAPPRVVIPRYIRDLADAAKRAAEPGQENLLAQTLAKHRAQIEKLNQVSPGFEQSLRPVSKQFIKNIKKATPEQVDKHVERWLLDKQRRHTQMVVRTETVEAYRDAYVQSTKQKPYVKGYKWQLSSGHPAPDICDIYASQDLHGLGPGGYPPASLPSTPHPNDLCIQTAIMDENHFERELAKRRGTREPAKPWLSGKKETGAEWLAKQPKAFQKKLLAPTRQQIFEKQPAAVLTKQGAPRSVKEAMQKAKP